jgi:hypothetical protein
VVDGLALVTVLVLDPDAIQHGSADLHSTPVASTPDKGRRPPAAAPPAQSRVPHPVAAEIPSYFEFGFGGAMASIWGPAPGLMWGWGASAHVNWVRPSPWSPHIRVSLLHYSREAFLARGGTANFSMNDVVLSLCPCTLRHASIRLSPCLGGSLGRLSAGGARTFVPVTETRTLAEADVQVALAWYPISHVELFLAYGAGLPLKRYSFGFEPYEFHRMPAVMLSGVAGVGLQFK